MAERTVLLHYHLFKNAGTSVDAVLRNNFGPAWVTREFSGQNTSAQVAHWITSEPEAKAFSSHTMMGPLPQVDGVRVISILMLRDPVARIKSAYRFERTQDAGTFGAVLARHTDLTGYVNVRLSLPHDRQCRNFQTRRLSSLVPGPEPELDRAKRALNAISVVGVVPDLAGMFTRLAPLVPGFNWTAEHRNKSAPTTGPQDEIDALLRAHNGDDLALVDYAKTLIVG